MAFNHVGNLLYEDLLSLAKLNKQHSQFSFAIHIYLPFLLDEWKLRTIVHI